MPANSPSGLFTQLTPLLAQRAVMITVSKPDDGDRLQVNICPRQISIGDNEALTIPLSISGTAAELDAELPAQLASFVAVQTGLHSNLTAIQREVAEAEKAARDEARKKQKGATNGKNQATAPVETTVTAAAPEPPRTLNLFEQAPEATAAATPEQPVGETPHTT